MLAVSRRLIVILTLVVGFAPVAAGQITIRERVPVSETRTAAAADPAPRYLLTLTIRSGLTSCGWDCFEDLDGDAAYTISGTRPDGSPFSVTVPVGSFLVESARYEQEGGCRVWGTGGPKSRGYVTYEDTPGATIELGQVAGPVDVTTNFGDPTWNRTDVWSGSVTAASYRKYHSYPFCFTGTRTRVEASVHLAEMLPSRLQVLADPRPRHGLPATVRVYLPDDEPAENTPSLVDVEVSRPDVARLDVPGSGRATTPDDGALPGVPFAATSGPGLGLAYTGPITRRSTYLRVTAWPRPEEDLFLRVGGTGLSVPGVRLTLTGPAAPLAGGETGPITGEAGDWSGPLPLDPNTPFQARAYYQDGTPDGVLVNARTGQRSASAVGLTLADLRAGRLAFEAGGTDGPPAAAARTASDPSGQGPAVPLPALLRQMDVEDWEREGLDAAPWHVPASDGAERPGAAAARLASSAGDLRRVRVDVEAVGTDVAGTVLFEVSAVTLSLAVTPDSVRVGEQATFTVEGAGLDPDTPVTLTVSDPRLGGFVAATPSARAGAKVVAREASVTRPVSAVGDVRFEPSEAVADTAAVTVTASANGAQGAVEVVVLPPEGTVHLLSANDEPYNRDVLLVSRFNPGDGGLDASIPFDSPHAGPSPLEQVAAWYDPFTQPGFQQSADAVDVYTVRPELRQAPAGLAVTFQVRVLRPWATDLRVEFPGLEGTVDGAPVYRADRPFRLVATAADDAEGATSPDQTLRVRLGDRLQVYAFADGVQYGNGLELRVAAPPGGDEPVAFEAEGALPERAGTMNWLWRSTVGGVQPALAATRASEAWAQAAVRFENRLPDSGARPDGTADPAWGGVDFAAVRNVLFLRYRLVGRVFKRATREAPAPGEFVVSGTVGGAPREARVPFAEGAPIDETVRAVVAAVEREFGVPVAWFQDAEDGADAEAAAAFVPVEEATRFYLVVGDARSPEVVLDREDRSREARTDRERLDEPVDFLLHHVAGLAAARGDGEPRTIEALVVPSGSLKDTADGAPVLGKGVGDRGAGGCLVVGPSGCETLHPIVNTLVVYPEHVDGPPDWPTIVPHELGHVLFGAGHPASSDDGAVVEHPSYQDSLFFREDAPVVDHVMFGAATADRSGNHQRRLDWQFVRRARTQGATGPAPVLR